MSCYTCTHCNKCGMFAVSAVTVCGECDTVIGPGTRVCPACGCAKLVTKMVMKDKDGNLVFPEDAK